MARGWAHLTETVLTSGVPRTGHLLWNVCCCCCGAGRAIHPRPVPSATAVLFCESVLWKPGGRWLGGLLSDLVTGAVTAVTW